MSSDFRDPTKVLVCLVEVTGNEVPIAPRLSWIQRHTDMGVAFDRGLPPDSKDIAGLRASSHGLDLMPTRASLSVTSFVPLSCSLPLALAPGFQYQHQCSLIPPQGSYISCWSFFMTPRSILWGVWQQEDMSQVHGLDSLSCAGGQRPGCKEQQHLSWTDFSGQQKAVSERIL